MSIGWKGVNGPSLGLALLSADYKSRCRYRVECVGCLATKAVGGSLMSGRSPLTYNHTQKAPWFLLLLAFAALFFTIAWVSRAELVSPAILLVAGLLMAVLGYSVQQLTVCDEGDRLAVRFGQQYRDYMARTGRFSPWRTMRRSNAQ